MSSTRRKGIGILVSIFVAIVMMFTLVVPAFAQQGPEIRVTDFESISDHQVVAVDSEGNVHIAYSVYPEGPLYSPGEPLDQADRWRTFATAAEDHNSNPQNGLNNGMDSWEIWYTMLDNNGNTLIDDTLITDIFEGWDADFPAIVVDSEDKVHIVWWEWEWEFDDLFYTKLDPSLDDQDGDAADESVITVIDDTRLTFFGDVYWGGPQIAIDSNDNIHIVFLSDDGICYLQIDNEGNINIAPIVLTTSSWVDTFSVAVDSNNNAHIAWDSLYDEYYGYYYENGSYYYEIYYMMLAGSDGSTLIDGTQITPDDGKKSKRPSLVVDFQDKVHIIWQDRRGLETEIYHTELDPSLDDQNGDSADESAITLIDDTALTPDDGDKSNHPRSAIQCGRYIHMTWNEEHEGGDGPAYLHYMVLDDDGSIVVADTALITEKTLVRTTPWSLANLDVDSNGKAHIVWCDNRDGGWDYFEVYYTNYEGQPCTCRPEFSATPTTGPTPLEVQFTDESARDFNSWSWDFGDGGSSNEQNPMHVYTRPGPFTVSLNVSGPCGSGTEIKVDYIHPYTSGVGGEAYPVNKLAVLAPWIALCAVIIVGAGSLVVVRHRITKA